MLNTAAPRPAEHLHSKRCLASAIISAVENIRDMENFSDHEFRLAAQDNDFLASADQYLQEGIATCTCPPCFNPGCCTDRPNGE